MTFAIKSTVVTGASCSPKTLENFLLRAAREKRRLVPHTWHLVALMPTSEPHAGQICGRGCCSPPPPKSPPSIPFHRSRRCCHTYESANSPPCEPRTAFL